MIAIDTVLGEPVVQAIGWALLHFVWQGALIAAVAAIALRALRHSAPDVRYVVAAIALALMATLPVVTGVQAWKAAGTAEAFRATEAAASPALAVAAASEAPDSIATSCGRPCETLLDGEVLGMTAGGVETWMPVFVAVWMLGVLLLAVRLVGGWLWIQRTTWRTAVPADGALQVLVQRLTRRLHIGRPVRLLTSRAVEVPTVIGLVKPTILLPMSALSGLSPQQIEAILAHELAHIRRHDYLVNLLQALLETLLFYHPAVWWLSGRIRAEREHCCDDLAVSLCGDPVVYARALADMEELRGTQRSLALAASGGPLLDRIRRLLAAPATHAGRGPAWIAAAGAVVLMLGIVVSAGTTPRPGLASSADNALPRLVGRTIDLLLDADRQPEWGADQQPPAPPAPPPPPAPPVPPVRGKGYAGVAPPALPPPPDLPPLPDIPAPPAPVFAPSAAAPAPAPLPPAPAASHVPPAPAPAQAPPAPPSVPAPPAPSVEIGGKGQESSGNFVWSSNGEKLEVKYRGTFELNEDDTDVVRMSPNGYLRIGDGKWIRGAQVEFQADGSGAITRRYYVGSSERPFETEGREWLRTNFPRFVRMSGFDARGRVARFYKRGGVDAVLREITLIEGSYAKKTYYVELLRLMPPDPAAARRILEQAAREITSDYEMATLLIGSADKLSLDDSSRSAFIDALGTIDSDYETRRVLSSALRRAANAPAAVARLLGAARSIGSDYEAASLLVQVARDHDLDGELRAPFFALLETVNSGHERGRVLQAVLRRGPVSNDTLQEVLRSVLSMSGHYEAGQVLQLAARTQSITGAARETYLKAADRLGQREQDQALTALVRSEKR